jgi:hypothetical protein
VTYRDRERLADILAAIEAIRSHVGRGELLDGLAPAGASAHLLAVLHEVLALTEAEGQDHHARAVAPHLSPGDAARAARLAEGAPALTVARAAMPFALAPGGPDWIAPAVQAPDEARASNHRGQAVGRGAAQDGEEHPAAGGAGGRSP